MAENNSGKEKGTSSSFDRFLPVEIIENILLRLPVKSLVRFKTVSKSWHAIISHPRFCRIHLHSHQSQNNSNNLSLLWGYPPAPDGICLAKLENHKFRTDQSVLQFPFGAATPLCSCNGILLLKEKISNTLVLWNPSIGKYTRFVCPLTKPYKYGLYYDSKADDFNVVIMSSLEHYKVYSCKNTSRAEIKPLPLPFGSGSMGIGPGVFFDGSFYWFSKADERQLLCFDVRDEKLNKLPQPNGLKDNSETGQVRLTVHTVGAIVLVPPAQRKDKASTLGNGKESCRQQLLLEGVNEHGGRGAPSILQPTIMFDKRR